MGLLPPPKPPFYDPYEWREQPWPERMRLACVAWADDGYGTPAAVYLLYLLKVLLYVAGWVFFCSFSRGLGSWRELGAWAFEPAAFQKAILWSMAFEGVGLGCASGTLTGRYNPPVAAFWHFLRPGTIKLPPWPKLPFFGGTRRRLFDAALYAAHYGFLVRVLLAPEVTRELVLPIVLLLPLLGLTDKTIFLAARAEHYLATVVCFLFVEDWLVGAMAVQLALWLWAGVSKLNRHFPAVVGVMTSNSPVLRWPVIRRAMYASFPADLRPSRVAHALAHLGIMLEFTFPLLLWFGEGGTVTLVGLVLMLVFHGYITSNFPMAVPIEWNVMVVYGGLFLFWQHPELSLSDLSSPALSAFLVGVLVLVPLVGNLWPERASFLLSMRYYAGNWAYSVWLFRGESAKKLDDNLIKLARGAWEQLDDFYDEGTILGLMGKVTAFRAMHLHGRALQTLVPKAVDDVDAYEFSDGELVAGMVLGWNFGDGHLHGQQLLHAVQQRCHFEPGELRHISVESQPLGRPRLHWQIRDAATGLQEEGYITVDELLERQPWPPHRKLSPPS